jgi:hypothetical protein
VVSNAKKVALMPEMWCRPDGYDIFLPKPLLERFF